MNYLSLKGWLDEQTHSETIQVAAAFARLEAERSGAFREQLLSLLDAQDYASLIDFPFLYTENENVSDLIHARQCVGFFKKLKSLTTLFGEDLEAKALKKFVQSETACRETNELFSSLSSGRLCLQGDTFQLLELARWKIEKMLGPVPEFATLRPKLGPGASTTVKRRKAIPAEKLNGRLACSKATIPWLPMIFSQLPHLWENSSSVKTDEVLDWTSETPNWELEEIMGGSDTDRYQAIHREVTTVTVEENPGVLSFVPKNATSYRAIVVEPVLSSMYQLAIGDYMAKRLRKNGVDITDQTTNQNLARLASVRGSLATLDLSSASDTVSTKLVEYLLPGEWFSLLSGFRSPTVSYENKRRKVALEFELEKFSSMGNGFTFPLETLIFYALVWAASEHHERPWINAYGDDLVCGSVSATRVISLLEFCGFTINKDKSYVSGPFRESCGKDYYRGIDIRPYHLEERVSGEVLFTMHNFFFRQFDDEMASLILSYIPPHLRIWGPDGYGDGHLLTKNPRMRLHQRRLGWAGYTFDTFARKPAKSFRKHPGDYLQVLYSVYVSEESAPEDPAELVIPEPWWFPEKDAKWAKESAGRRDVLKAGPKGQVMKIYPSSGKQYKRLSIYTLSLG